MRCRCAGIRAVEGLRAGRLVAPVETYTTGAKSAYVRSGWRWYAISLGLTKWLRGRLLGRFLCFKANTTLNTVLTPMLPLFIGDAESR